MEKLNRLCLGRLVRLERVRFLTLTFPPEVAPDVEVAYAVLRRFLERLRRAYPKVACPWVLELQESGNPHFHLLWLGQVLSRATLVWIREVWEGCIGWDALAAGHHCQVNVERVRSEKEVCSYMASYVSKGVARPKLDSGAYPHGEGSGFRWWGVHNRGALPLGELVKEVGRFSRTVYAWRRAVRRSLEARIRAGELGLRGLVDRLKAGPIERVQGWLLYTDSPEEWLRCFALLE